MSLCLAISVGLLAAYGSFRWASDSERPLQRAREEAVVLAARDVLGRYLGVGNLQISDALERVKEAGKVYIYPVEGGWELSGHYRRGSEKIWHAYLLLLDDNDELIRLSVDDNDPQLGAIADKDARFITGT